MLQRFVRMGRPDPLPDAPVLSDITALGLDDIAAADALRFLQAQHAAGRLDYYRRQFDHDWLIWLPNEVVRGGRRLELGEWVIEWLIGALPGGAR